YARTALRLLLEANVEPDRTVERGVLVDEDRLQLRLEGLGFLVVGEVATLLAPRDCGVDDAADHLPHARLALGGGEPAAEVLLGDDVRRRLRPELRELDAALLERGAAAARDQRVADLPFDLVERVAAGNREEPANAEPRACGGDGVDHLFRRTFPALLLFYARHTTLQNCSRSPDSALSAGTGGYEAGRMEPVLAAVRGRRSGRHASRLHPAGDPRGRSRQEQQDREA